MSAKNVFEHTHYRTYLTEALNDQGLRSGRRADFAKALRCQSSFISQVLHDRVHLSLEQAYRTNAFLNHSSEQEHFFMLLVHKDRAGSSELAEYYQKQIEAIVAERSKIKTRVQVTHELDPTQQARYYSHADFAVVHMALAIPQLRSPPAISRAFQIPEARVEMILNFLVSAGMAEYDGQGFKMGGIHLHLSADSPFVNQHHANWRLQSLRHMKPEAPDHLHYSGVYSLSRKDFKILRENLMRVIQENLAVLKPSPEEIVVAQMIDLIPLEEPPTG